MWCSNSQQSFSLVRMPTTYEHWELCYISFCDPGQGHICDFKMEFKLEQKTDIKFSIKLGKTSTETFQMSQKPYYNEPISCPRYSEGYLYGRIVLEDKRVEGGLPQAQPKENLLKLGRLCINIFKNSSGHCDTIDVSYTTVHPHI